MLDCKHYLHFHTTVLLFMGIYGIILGAQYSIILQAQYNNNRIHEKYTYTQYTCMQRYNKYVCLHPSNLVFHFSKYLIYCRVLKHTYDIQVLCACTEHWATYYIDTLQTCTIVYIYLVLCPLYSQASININFSPDQCEQSVG